MEEEVGSDNQGPDHLDGPDEISQGSFKEVKQANPCVPYMLLVWEDVIESAECTSTTSQTNRQLAISKNSTNFATFPCSVPKK